MIKFLNTYCSKFNDREFSCVIVNPIRSTSHSTGSLVSLSHLNKISHVLKRLFLSLKDLLTHFGGLTTTRRVGIRGLETPYYLFKLISNSLIRFLPGPSLQMISCKAISVISTHLLVIRVCKIQKIIL